MQLNEIFKADTGAKFKISDTATQWKATTKVKDGDVLAIKAKYVKDDDAWYVVFTINGNTEATDDNTPFQVMPQVMEALRLFVEAKKPTHVQIESVERNRTRVYIKLIKRVLPDWHIYNLEDFQLNRIDIMKEPAKVILTDDGGVVNFIKRPGFVVKEVKGEKVVLMNKTLNMREYYVPDFPDLFMDLLKKVMKKHKAKVSRRETELIRFAKKRGVISDEDVSTVG